MTELETIREQRDKAVAELKNIRDAKPEDWDIETINQFKDWAQNRARYTLATIEAQIAGESNPVSPRVQIIRRAKAIIEALNLPGDGGIVFDPERKGWVVCEITPDWWDSPNMQCWRFYGPVNDTLQPYTLDPWVKEWGWKNSLITRTTEEV